MMTVKTTCGVLLALCLVLSMGMESETQKNNQISQNRMMDLMKHLPKDKAKLPVDAITEMKEVKKLITVDVEVMESVKNIAHDAAIFSGYRWGKDKPEIMSYKELFDGIANRLDISKKFINIPPNWWVPLQVIVIAEWQRVRMTGSILKENLLDKLDMVENIVNKNSGIVYTEMQHTSKLTNNGDALTFDDDQEEGKKVQSALQHKKVCSLVEPEPNQEMLNSEATIREVYMTYEDYEMDLAEYDHLTRKLNSAISRKRMTKLKKMKLKKMTKKENLQQMEKDKKQMEQHMNELDQRLAIFEKCQETSAVGNMLLDKIDRVEMVIDLPTQKKLLNHIIEKIAKLEENPSLWSAEGVDLGDEFGTMLKNAPFSTHRYERVAGYNFQGVCSDFAAVFCHIAKLINDSWSEKIYQHNDAAKLKTEVLRNHDHGWVGVHYLGEIFDVDSYWAAGHFYNDYAYVRYEELQIDFLLADEETMLRIGESAHAGSYLQPGERWEEKLKAIMEKDKINEEMASNEQKMRQQLVGNDN